MKKKMQKLCSILLQTIALLLLSVAAWAQTVVSGKVTDAKDGTPVAGVSITVKGTKTSTQTAGDGTYRLTVPAGAKLVFSSVGFTTQELTAAQNLDVSFASAAQQMNEVVVVGYGTARKKDLTGAMTSITSKDFQKGAITTPEQLILGKVAGVSITSNGGAPGSGSTIRIRGGASLRASNDPLIIIDGVQLSGGGIAGSANALALINPNDIESFNILKDASAAAIYGSRASNGVIIITTKKGRGGKPTFNFNTQLSVGTVSKKIDVLSTDEFRNYVQTYGTPAQVALMGAASTDWQKEIYQTAIGTDNNLSMTGGLTGKFAMPYRVSVGYLNQDGVLRTGNLQRVSAGINLSPTFLNNHLKVDINLKGSNSKSRFANEGAIGAAVSFDPTQPVKTGSPRFGGYYEWLDASAATGLKGLAPSNPVSLLLERDDRSSVNRSVGNVQFDYKFHFLPELRANVNLGYDVAEGKGTIFVNDSVKSAYQRDVDESGKRKGGINNTYLQKIDNKQFEAYLNYAKDLRGIKSRIDLTTGYGFYDNAYYNFNYADYFVDGTKRVNSDPAFATDTPQNRLISFYGRLNYTLNQKYILTVNVRTDGSSRLNPDNRWITYHSEAFAWRIKEENFLKNVSAISDLKLRIGYGITGQQDGISNYSYLANYSISNATAQYQFGESFYNLYRPVAYNANLRWEQTATSNIGLDFGFLNNRISGGIDFYIKKTKDLLNDVNQSAGTNFAPIVLSNVGNMENKGVEFTLNTTPIQKQDLTWDFGFNVTYNRNRITKLTFTEDPNYPGQRYGGISGGTGNSVLINSVGYNRGAYYVYQQVYDKATGKPIENLFEDRDRDGIITDKDLYRYKSANPDVFLGFNSTVTYKRFNAGFVMRASLGNYMYNNVHSSTGIQRNIINPLNYLSNGSANILESGFTGSGPRFFQSDYYVQNASFLRMDNINIGYAIGKLFNNKATLRANANVQNAFVITKYKGADPEINGGIDNNFYPRPRTFVFGLNLDF
ncbi:MAG: SusC/RagA family TonB-linked outer membrane protein [Bacteroidota bacterium]